MPVLCTTATANDRVVADIVEQLGDELVDVPRPARPGEPAPRTWPTLPSQAERLAWLAEHASRAAPAPASSTRSPSPTRERVAAWLRTQGIDAEAYSGETDTDDRVRLEQRLLANELKALVAT